MSILKWLLGETNEYTATEEWESERAAYLLVSQKIAKIRDRLNLTLK